METARLTARGCSVNGNATVCRRGRTGSSEGSGGVGSDMPRRFGQFIRGPRVVPYEAWMSDSSLPSGPNSGPPVSSVPGCRPTTESAGRWLRRTKKAQPPSGADQRARAMFDKVKDHLVRVDDDVTC